MVTVWSRHMDWTPSNDNTTKTYIPSKRRWSLRIFLVPVAVLGMLGFAINYCNISFMYALHGTCLPKNHIVFLKTHKTAGSSIQNILMRYGHLHNLTFVLPAKGNYLGHPQPFNVSMVLKPRLPSYNILAHHTRFNYDTIKTVMKDEAIFITIVRDPVHLFESSYIYYDLERFYNMSLQSFASASSPNDNFTHRRYRKKFGLNQMMFDLGATEGILNDLQLAEEYVNKLDLWFDFVLVTERMDESLVLLKELLCWTIDDVVAFKVNARNPLFRSSLNETQQRTLRTLNAADHILYNHFSNKLTKQIEAIGRNRIANDVYLLRHRQDEWYKLCVQGVRPVTKVKNKYSNSKVMTFEPRNNIHNITCNALTIEELDYTDYLRLKQVRAAKRKRKHLARQPRVSRRSRHPS